MPFLQVFCSHLNESFGPGEVDESLAARLHDPEHRLADAVEAFELAPDLQAALREHLLKMPRAMEAALKALLVANVDEYDRRPITFAWMPGYDWELTISDVADAQTRGGVTVLVRSRYPSHPSPVQGR
jgi:hypothetical protein